MNSVNTLCNVDVSQKKSNSFSKLPYVLALCTMLNIADPTEIKADNVTNNNLSSVEVVISDCDIIGKIEKKTWVALPNSYSQKFRDFVSNSKILKDKDARNYTENFVVKQMLSNRWITKQNQLLFILDAIYEQITSNNIYTWEDGNDNRLAEFENVMDKIDQCWKDYNSWFKKYMRQRSADAQQRSADAQQRSADAQQETVKLTKIWLNQLIEFYDLYRRDPSSVKQEQISQSIKNSKKIIQNCKKYNIDYKAKLSPEIRKFYGID